MIAQNRSPRGKFHLGAFRLFLREIYAAMTENEIRYCNSTRLCNANLPLKTSRTTTCASPFFKPDAAALREMNFKARGRHGDANVNASDIKTQNGRNRNSLETTGYALYGTPNNNAARITC